MIEEAALSTLPEPNAQVLKNRPSCFLRTYKEKGCTKSDITRATGLLSRPRSRQMEASNEEHVVRVMARTDEQLDQLSDRMNNLMNQGRRGIICDGRESEDERS
nr:hypothetical protein [Tanacetum cinerariifolium]